MNDNDIDYLITLYNPSELVGLIEGDYILIPGNVKIYALFGFDHVLDYILSKLPNKSSNVTIIYDWRSEGFIIEVLKMMNYVNERLIKEHNLSMDNFAYACAALNCASNVEYYKQIRSILPYVPLKVYCETIWETQYNMIEHEPVPPDHIITSDKEKKFICLNRGARPHRIALFSQLLDNHLLDDCFLTFYQHDNSPVTPYLFPNLATSINMNHDRMQSLVPIALTLEDDLSNAYYLTDEDIRLHQSCLFSLITETVFCSNMDVINSTVDYLDFLTYPCILISEKTWRTINQKHPFIILGNYKFLYNLREHGYKTFHPYIDESYDLIENDEERLLAVVKEVKRLSNMSDTETVEWLTEVHKITKFNYDLYKSREFTITRLGE